jgi:hypothetical protein
METVKEATPKIGMSVSMGIGSNSYHQIIVKMERNSKTIYTMPARIVLGGVALSDWNELPESIKAKRAADALQQDLDFLNAEFGDNPKVFSADWMMSQATKCFTYRAKAGYYAKKGSDYCWLALNDQYEYSSPEF